VAASSATSTPTSSHRHSASSNRARSGRCGKAARPSSPHERLPAATGRGCVDFWSGRLEGFAGAEQWAAIARRLTTEVDATGLALFAGWRAEALPEDLAGRVALLLHVLRELRGGVHIVAVVAVGLTPLEAVVSAGGVGDATRFGWSGPFPEADDRRRSGRSPSTSAAGWPARGIRSGGSWRR